MELVVRQIQRFPVAEKGSGGLEKGEPGTLGLRGKRKGKLAAVTNLSPILAVKMSLAGAVGPA